MLLNCSFVTVQRGQGDPQGRRIARRKNLQLAEAERAGRAFGTLLSRAKYDAPELDALLATLHDEEANELLRSSGRIESRQRFKYKSGQPLHENRVDDFLFLDESGRSDFRSPGEYFVLGGVAMTQQDADLYVEQADALKLQFFGRHHVP